MHNLCVCRRISELSYGINNRILYGVNTMLINNIVSTHQDVHVIYLVAIQTCQVGHGKA